MSRERLVVVGNGMAGLRFLEELLRRAPGKFEVAVVGAEPEPAYNRVLLSSLLAGDIASADVQMRPREWYAEHGVTLVTGQPATAIDVVGKTVQLSSGQPLAFDKLLLAIGSEAIRLPLPGRDLAGVMTFRSLADIEGLEQAASTGAPAVVIGGGLLGIEAAYGLARRGIRVTLVHLMDRLMERQLDAEGGRLLADAIEAKGVRVLLGAETGAIRGSSAVEAVELKDGRVLPCGLVVMAAVNFGAEVIADGHIHVYAPLRGRAIAGARGNTAARIFSTCMEPQLVAIAGTYRTTDTALPADVLGKPAQVRLDGDTLVVEPLPG